MTKERMVSFIKTMACSQGFYGRILRDYDMDDLYQAFMNSGGGDEVTFVMWLEG